MLILGDLLAFWETSKILWPLYFIKFHFAVFLQACLTCISGSSFITLTASAELYSHIHHIFVSPTAVCLSEVDGPLFLPGIRTLELSAGLNRGCGWMKAPCSFVVTSVMDRWALESGLAVF